MQNKVRDESKCVKWLQSHRMLLWALLTSIMLHFFMLNHSFFSLPVIEKNDPIVIKLIRAEPQKTTPQTIATNAEKPIPKKLRKKPATLIEPKNDIPPQTAESISHLTPSDAVTTDSAALPISSSNNENTPTPASQQIEEDALTSDNIAVSESSVPLPESYTYLKTISEVKRGEDKIGKTVVTLNIKKDYYELESVFTPSGVAALFVKELKESSMGFIDQNGIVPYLYQRQYGNSKEKEQIANFAWQDHVVEFGNTQKRQVYPLEQGTQDFLSFMYQFMFVPPLNDMQITMANGKKLKTYIYTFVGEETLSTKLGELKTIHLLKQGDDDEKTELWLATEYKHIPVQIRKTEKDGTIYEQTVINISTDTAIKNNTRE